MWSQQGQLQVMSNNPFKYEQILSYGFRGVAFTKCHGRSDGQKALVCPSVADRLGDNKGHNLLELGA